MTIKGKDIKVGMTVLIPRCENSLCIIINFVSESKKTIQFDVEWNNNICSTTTNLKKETEYIYIN